MQIKAFLKDNPMLVFGLGLPFMMVMIFALAGGLFEMTYTPPQHDVFYTGGSYYPDKEKGVLLDVEGDRLVVTAPEGGCHQGEAPKLLRYSARDNTLKEILIKLPPRHKAGIVILDPMQVLGKDKVLPETSCATAKRVQVSVPELEGVRVTDSTIAPDGYQFLPYDYRDGRSGILPMIFFGHDSERYRGVLKKEGHRHVLPDTGTRYQSPQFVAWVIP